MTDIDLTGRTPPVPDAVRDLLTACLAEAVRAGDTWLTPPRLGDDELRVELAKMGGWDPDDVIVTSGVRAAAVALVPHCDRLLLEAPSYRGIARIAEEFGVATHRAGWDDLAALPNGARSLLWLTSPCRNPDGATLTAAQCRSLSRVAALTVQNRVYDPWAPEAPTVDGAIVLGSLGKLAGGGARLGWAVGAAYHESAGASLRGATPPAPWQRAWALFLARDGERMWRTAVVSTVERARAAFAAEARWLLDPPAHGPFVFLPLPAGLGEDEALDRMAAAGVRAGPGRDFGAVAPAVRLCFTAVTTGEAAAAAHRIAFLFARSER